MYTCAVRGDTLQHRVTIYSRSERREFVAYASTRYHGWRVQPSHRVGLG
jgi:hypothetical protein